MNVVVPPFSVVIPTRGEKGVVLTTEALESLHEFHGYMAPHMEVFVVQDGESRSDLAKVCENYSYVTCLVNDTPGFASACNLGIEASSGHIVFLMNNDVRFYSNTLHALFAFMRATECGVCAPMLLYPDGRVQHAGVKFVEVNGAELPGYWDHYCRGAAPQDPLALRVSDSLLTGALLGISRQAIDMVGLLDPRFGFTCEDIDYCLRCLEIGLSSVYCGILSAIHMEGASRGRTPEEKMEMAPDVAEREIDALKKFFDKWADIDMRRFNLGVAE